MVCVIFCTAAYTKAIFSPPHLFSHFIVTTPQLKRMHSNEEYNKTAMFYKQVLLLLKDSGIEFMVGGSYAVFEYTDTTRETKDMDIYCRPRDYPKMMKFFADKGYETQLYDVRWLAKVFDKEGKFIDIIFDTVNNLCKVDDEWFRRSRPAMVFDMNVQFIAPEHLIWGKMYVMNRERYDGADVNHLLLKQGRNIDWNLLKELMEPNWHILLSHLLMFQFVYPADYAEIMPRWLFDELIERAREQYDIPHATEKVCRGPWIDQTQYQVDIKEWNYKSYTIKTV
jgi:hypothetical protein